MPKDFLSKMFDSCTFLIKKEGELAVVKVYSGTRLASFSLNTTVLKADS